MNAVEAIDPYSKVAVIGAGAWGTALAATVARSGRDVTLWARELDVVASIRQTRTNPDFLPDIVLPETLNASPDLACAGTAEAILFVVPAQFARHILNEIAQSVVPETPIVLCAKGLEQESGLTMVQVLSETVPHAVPSVLSGPSFAHDVARGLPTAVTLACAIDDVSERLAATIHTPTFRIYQSDDLTGAELGGAIKNVFAIACGIVEGLNLGESARAALIARGFAELRRLAMALGGRPETLAGLCGLGDLVLTCTSMNSRNMALGMAIGQGQSVDEFMAGRKTVSEGYYTARAVIELANAHQIEMPICKAVRDVLHHGVPVDQAIEQLLQRPAGDEFDPSAIAEGRS